MPPPARRLTAIARSVDPRLPSTRLPLLAAAAVAVVATVLELTAGGAGIPEAAGAGVRYGVGAFLAWAIARELDPDRPRSAQLALLAYLPAAALGAPALAASTVLLLAARVTLRSTGRPPTLVDLGALVLFAGMASTTAAGLVAAGGLAWALHDDRRLPDPAPDVPHEVAAIATVAVAILVTVVTGSFLDTWRGPGLAELAWLAVTIAAVTRLRRPAVLHSHDDRGRGRLHPARLTHARWLVVAALAVSVVWAGGQAVAGLAPASAALVGTALVAPRLLTRRDVGTPADATSGPA